MLRILCFLLFILYSFAIYSYLSINFTTSTKSKQMFNVLMGTNLVIAFIVLSLKIILPNPIFMMIFLALLIFEIKLIFNDDLLKSIYAGVSITINFFSIKIILISIYSVLSNESIRYIMEDFKLTSLFLIMTFAIRIVLLTIFKNIFPVKYMNMMTTDRENMKFCISIVLAIYLYLLINSYLLYLEGPLISIINIKIGICSLIGFLLSVLYGYLFAKLKLYAVRAESIEKELQEDKEALEQLKSEALYDDFTSCFKREFIEEELTELISNKIPFCLVFIDIDGLKTTNDVFGHDEGDFYIKCIANILNEEFAGNIIARIGGDEFLILLENSDIYQTMKYVVRSFERAEQISTNYDKPYETSISYGVVNVTDDNKLSKEEIIELADKYMYNFKKSRKKNRK